MNSGTKKTVLMLNSEVARIRKGNPAMPIADAQRLSAKRVMEIEKAEKANGQHSQTGLEGEKCLGMEQMNKHPIQQQLGQMAGRVSPSDSMRIQAKILLGQIQEATKKRRQSA